MRRLLALAAVLAVWRHRPPPPLHARSHPRHRAFRIGYRADAKPYSYQDDNGQPAGYIVDLCLEVAAALGAEHRPAVSSGYPADQRFESVRDGRVDILCDPSSVTLPRREIVDFSLPTFLDGAGVHFAHRQAGPQFRGLSPASGSACSAAPPPSATLRTSLDELNSRRPSYTVPDHRAGLDLLYGRQARRLFRRSRHHRRACCRRADGPGFAISKQYFSYETYALALPRDDGAFRLLVDRTLAQLYRTGKINAILEKTFGKAPLDELLKAMIVHQLVAGPVSMNTCLKEQQEAARSQPCR